MSAQELLHLAVVTAAAPPPAADLHAAVLASARHAGESAERAFAAVPGLRAFSWHAPELDRLLAGGRAPDVASACAAAALALSAAAATLRARLRVCGRDGDAEAAQPRWEPDGGRTLLWFRRYEGRDEIVRAARRYLIANPGRPLGDGELDAWLDTAGVPDPDLVIYAGGPLVVRDTLLWQASYAEIWHAPEAESPISEGMLRAAVNDYHLRQRRFGR